MLVNISGHLTDAALKPRFRCRVFIDLDPGYTQFWHAAGLAEDRLRDHDFYFSVGENIGQPFCGVPTGGVALAARSASRSCSTTGRLSRPRRPRRGSRPSPAGVARWDASHASGQRTGQGARVQKIHAVADAQRALLSSRVGGGSCRSIGSRRAAQEWLACRRSERRGAGSADVSTVRAAVQRRVLRRPRDLRRYSVGLVQRPYGSVSRIRQAGSGTGYRLVAELSQ